MSLLIKVKGISKLSELEIDTDKDWNLKGIFNIKEIARGMAIGHIAQRNDTKMVKLPPGIANYVLTSQGPGKLLTWAPGGTYLARYYPVSIELSHAEAIAVVDHSLSKGLPIPTALGYQRDIGVGHNLGWFRMLKPEVALSHSEAIVTVDQHHRRSVAVDSEGGAKMLVAGALAYEATYDANPEVWTDETVAARNTIVDDMHLLPGATRGLYVNDAYYFGFARTFDRVWVSISTAGSGNYALAHEYWNGTAWALLLDTVDDTDEFCTGGTNKIQFTRPGDWATTTLEWRTLYWIRARVTEVVNYVTQPLGARAWCEVLA